MSLSLVAKEIDVPENLTVAEIKEEPPSLKFLLSTKKRTGNQGLY